MWGRLLREGQQTWYRGLMWHVLSLLLKYPKNRSEEKVTGNALDSAASDHNSRSNRRAGGSMACAVGIDKRVTSWA